MKKIKYTIIYKVEPQYSGEIGEILEKMNESGYGEIIDVTIIEEAFGEADTTKATSPD